MSICEILIVDGNVKVRAGGPFLPLKEATCLSCWLSLNVTSQNQLDPDSWTERASALLCTSHTVCKIDIIKTACIGVKTQCHTTCTKAQLCTQIRWQHIRLTSILCVLFFEMCANCRVIEVTPQKMENHKSDTLSFTSSISRTYQAYLKCFLSQAVCSH